MTTSGKQKVFKLECSVHNNDWGKTGSDSTVANLIKQGNDQFAIDEKEHYAELWMGTHPSGPSYIKTEGGQKMSLTDWLSRNPERAGSGSKNPDGSLPFLMKVLSVEKTLAIQIHPDKSNAEKLHKKMPEIYTDSNHKPEMAIALTPFKTLVGFRGITEIAELITKIKTLNRVVGDDNVIHLLNVSKVDDDVLHKKAIRRCVQTLLNHDLNVIQKEVDRLLLEIKEQEMDEKEVEFYMPDFIRRLNKDYQGDVGIFLVYFLNILSLEPGEAVFIDANTPHAYISGDCIECMACSHNVIRAGLTRKYRDTDTFCNLVNYGMVSRDQRKIKPSLDDKLQPDVKEALFQPYIENQRKMKPAYVDTSELGVKETLFQPYIEDFAIIMIQVCTPCKTLNLKSLEKASICLVYQGEGEACNSTLTSPISFNTGTVVFIAARESLKIDVTSEAMLIFRAYSNFVC